MAVWVGEWKPFQRADKHRPCNDSDAVEQVCSHHSDLALKNVWGKSVRSWSPEIWPSWCMLLTSTEDIRWPLDSTPWVQRVAWCCVEFVGCQTCQQQAVWMNKLTNIPIPILQFLICVSSHSVDWWRLHLPRLLDTARGKRVNQLRQGHVVSASQVTACGCLLADLGNWLINLVRSIKASKSRDCPGFQTAASGFLCDEAKGSVSRVFLSVEVFGRYCSIMSHRNISQHVSDRTSQATKLILEIWIEANWSKIAPYLRSAALKSFPYEVPGFERGKTRRWKQKCHLPCMKSAELTVLCSARMVNWWIWWPHYLSHCRLSFMAPFRHPWAGHLKIFSAASFVRSTCFEIPSRPPIFNAAWSAEASA